MMQHSPDEEIPSENTYIFDSENLSELARLTNQGRLLTESMGGALAGLDGEDLARLRNIVDLGCGPGDWVLDVAFARPDVEVAGLDISRLMVDYANARAHSQGLINASFGVMDITRPLDFADNSFDMVNARLLFGVLKREKWAPLLRECLRVLRPGGLLRLTEPLDLGSSSSPALEKLSAWFCQVLWKGGYCFSVNGNTVGLAHRLPRMLREAGFLVQREMGYALDFSTDSENWTDIYHNLEIACYMAQPLFVKAGLANEEEAAACYQRMLIEVRADDFCGAWHYCSILARKP